MKSLSDLFIPLNIYIYNGKSSRAKDLEKEPESDIRNGVIPNGEDEGGIEWKRQVVWRSGPSKLCHFYL